MGGTYRISLTFSQIGFKMADWQPFCFLKIALLKVAVVTTYCPFNVNELV